MLRHTDTHQHTHTYTPLCTHKHVFTDHLENKVCFDTQNPDRFRVIFLSRQNSVLFTENVGTGKQQHFYNNKTKKEIRMRKNANSPVRVPNLNIWAHLE